LGGTNNNFKTFLAGVSRYFDSKTTVLMGACEFGNPENTGFVKNGDSAMKLLSEALNKATIFGYKSYCMSISFLLFNMYESRFLENRYREGLEHIGEWSKTYIDDNGNVNVKDVESGNTVKLNIWGKIYETGKD
jgi:hypothetical protein